MEGTLQKQLSMDYDSGPSGEGSTINDYVGTLRWYQELHEHSSGIVQKVPASDLLNLSNPVFTSFVFWYGLLLAKMLVLLVATVRLNAAAHVSGNNVRLMEYLIIRRYTIPSAQLLDNNNNRKVSLRYVERLWRALRNDAENILPLLFVGVFYMLSHPEARLAFCLFRTIGIGRILHTVLYSLIVLPQPARFCAFFVPFCACGFMAVKATMFFAGEGSTGQPEWALI